MTDRFAHLLDRDPHGIKPELVAPVVTGKTVLITGAGGSIGSEIAKVAAQYRPGCMVLMDRSEPALFRIHRHLTLAGGWMVVPVLGDVSNESEAEQVVARFKPDVVFHAAAHKHVPLMEDHPAQAVKNNVIGTLNMVRACQDVPRFVLVSSDKAVNPAGVMGQTKRIAEMLVLNQPEWSVVRFGNVIGSSGSVVETWEAQVEAGVPVTVTSPAMTRYFITVNEAAGLVIQCAAMGGGGYVLDMGEPVNIMHLAARFAPPGWPINVTGIRPGEKVAEELWYSHEATEATAHPGILRFNLGEPSDVVGMVADMERQGAGYDNDKAAEFLHHWTSSAMPI